MQLRKWAFALLALLLAQTTSMGQETLGQTPASMERVCEYLEQFVSDLNSAEDTQFGSTKAALNCDAKEYSVAFHATEFAIGNAPNVIDNMQSTIKNGLCDGGWEPAFQMGWTVKIDIYYDSEPLRPTFIVSDC